MNTNNNEGKTTTASVYRLLQNPAPICMFYFAHPFGIASPASGAKLAQVRDKATNGCKAPVASESTAAKCTNGNGTANGGQKLCKPNGKLTTGDGVRNASKPQRKINGLCSGPVNGDPKQCRQSHREPPKRSKKHRTHRRISNFEKFLLEIQHSHTCGRGSSKVRHIDREDRLTPLVPWPSIIWNRDFLIPTLLQALAQQHGRKIPDIEQILRTVRSAWNTPKSQRSYLQSQDSRESSASNWDLSSLCDSCCLNPVYQRMGAGTYANATSPGPGLLRRRYSVPEIIMRKHTLAQQKTDDESLWLHHDTNHNVIEVVVNKHTGTASARGILNGRLSGPRTPPHRKSFGLRHHRDHHSSLTGRSSSVESGGGGGAGGGSGAHDWLAGTIPPGTGALIATGSDPNLAALKHRNLAGGRCSSPLCNGIGSSRAVATGTGGSLRSIHNNSLSCSSSSSLNGGPLANGGAVGGGVGAGVVGGGCGHQQHHPLVPSYRDGEYSMRKTTLLRRMWSRELRRYERSGSWSPPLRRTPPRIYSVESIIASVEGHQSPSRADDSESVLGERVGSGRPGSSGSGSSVGSGRCATTATTTTTGTTDTTGTTSCLECAKLERQYNGDFGTGKKLLSRTTHSRDIDCSGQASGGHQSPVPPVSPAPSDPATVDDRRQRRRRRMCSSQTADLGESEPTIILAAVSAAATVLEGEHEQEDVNHPVNDQVAHDNDEHDDLEDEYPSHSSSVSSIASQSYRVSSATRVRHDNESDLSEFLQQERLAAADGDGVDRTGAREGASVRTGSAGTSDYPRERTPVTDGAAGATAARASEGVETSEPTGAVEEQFPPGSKRRPSEDSSVAESAALSEDSDSSTDDGGEIKVDDRTTHGVSEAERARLDEYISELLLDNLNNLADAKELVLATDTRDGETEIVGVYSERRAQLRDPKPTESDRQNNNQPCAASEPQNGNGTMKQKFAEKYIGDGGGVVCNSPPQTDKHKLSPKRPDGGAGAECDKENEEDVANNNKRNSNNNNNNNSNNNNNGSGPVERNHRRQKTRAKGNGFFLRSGSRSPRRIDPAINGGATEIDLNGKYYFPAYGLETDPSDNTDIASEPEGLVLGKIGTGSTYDRGSVVVPRFSAMPRTESMEVQPSSTNSAEDDLDVADGTGRRDDADDGADDDDDDDSDTSSLVDSLDGFGSAQLMEPMPRTRKPKHPKPETVESTTSSNDRSPRHEKGEAFFVPIHAETTAALRINERVVVADTMPLRIKERLNNRRRLMKWKQEQENLKKQRKMMRLIEQKRFYGEPAIQVISTIDKAISRKEFIPPGAKKTVFGGASSAIVRDTSTPSAPTPFRAMKPKKRAGGAAATSGSALRSELGMLESYKIDGKGNMQIQSAAAGAASGRKGGGAAPPIVSAKSPWGLAADKRQGKTPQAQSTASTTVGSSGRTSTGRTGTGKAPAATDGRRRQQVLKDVQQMTLYPQADLTPDIEGGPRRVYQKTEIQEGDKHIEILEIVECADSAPRGGRHGGGRAARVHSAGRRHERGGGGGGRGESGNRHRSRIPVPIYRFGQYRRSTHSRDGSPLSTGSNPKVDRMIADLLLEALSNPEEVGVKLVRTPETLRDTSRSSSKSRPSGASTTKKSVSSNSNSGGGNNNLLTPRRTASGRYTQKFEVIPEERSSVSIESSTEELSAGGGGGRKKGPHPSPRRVSFDENHQILNRDELEAPTVTTLLVPSPSPKRQPVTSSPAKSPTRSQPGAGVKKQGTATVMTGAGNTGTTNTTITTSRGKAAIQSDVIEERGWIGFSTQHEDMATPVPNGQDDEADSFVTDSLNAKLTPASGPSFPSLPSSAVRCCEANATNSRQTNGEKQWNGKELVDIVPYHHHHRLPAPPFQHQIREENAWQVFQTGDCKVIQSKIEYYETSIHRTPLTGGGDGGEFFASAETSALCPHTAAPLSTADSLEDMAARSSTGSWHRQRTTSFGPGSDAPPKTSDTTCSSCCFCNPELHNHTASSMKSIADGCFYCRAKLGQSPTRSFPAPPTPPNIQTSPVPPSPQTPITELTPTPSLHEITVPVRKSSLARSTGKDVKMTDPGVKSRDDPQPKRGDVATKTKQPKPPPTETVSDKSSKRSAAVAAAKPSTAATVSTVSTGSEEGPQKPLPPVPGATPKLARKKPTEPGGVLNRPKYTNHLTRASTVVQSVQKEIKNELRAPIRVLPKTAKEVSNRKEKERQIGLNLPKDYDCRTRRPTVKVLDDAPMQVVVAGGSAETHGYDNETSSSDTSDGDSMADSSPNVSPFKRPNLQQQQPQQPQQQSLPSAAQPPTAATRWKTNSERNLSQLAIQKLVSASRWGSKWRKGATRDGSQQLEPSDRNRLAEEDDVVMASVGSCSELSPLKMGTTGGSGGGMVGSTAGTTTTSNIISGITQSSSNQGWTVTVAGNYNPEMAPDVEMRLSFPKGAAGGGSGGKSALTSSAATSSLRHAPDTSSGSYSHSNGPSGAGRNRHPPYADGDGGDHLDGGGGYLGASRSTSRGAGALPPTSSNLPGTLNPRRNLTRSDGTGAGGTTGKDYRLPNVGSTHNIPARPTPKKAIKTVECSVVASATRTIANSYHQLSHQHQAANSGPLQQQQQQQQHHSRAPPMSTVRGGGRPRPGNQLLPQASAQVLHPTLQNGSGGKFLSSSSPSLVSQQQHPSQRFHHTDPSYHLEDYGNVYYGHQQQPQPRRMSLDSQQQQQQQQQQHHPTAVSPMATDCLSVMGNAIAPELKPRVPTMSERDLTRRHHVCYTRTQPYFS
ncbi:uncharacterized protein LOC118507698 isoform X2 [Anopheles stephensi]|uniref:uncharacterized protein LOC118507698 isoform X2 n=1 Tax=Anopheles stephensi TaxID=30069 RepID=UPI0016589124|nr:uncharacterized protein LOC118507698 isoform X2 [Anopheles stephensi]